MSSAEIGSSDKDKLDLENFQQQFLMMKYKFQVEKIRMLFYIFINIVHSNQKQFEHKILCYSDI